MSRVIDFGVLVVGVRSSMVLDMVVGVMKAKSSCGCVSVRSDGSRLYVDVLPKEVDRGRSFGKYIDVTYIDGRRDLVLLKGEVSL